MPEWIHSRLRRLRPDLQFMLVLLLMAVSLFAWMSVMGCDCGGSPGATNTDIAPERIFHGHVFRGLDAQIGGQTASRSISGTWEGVGPPDYVNYQWTPPKGATNFTWTRGPEPDNPDGPPPFVWTTVPSSADIGIEFTLPPVPAEKESYVTVDTLQTQCEGSNPEVETLYASAYRPDAGVQTQSLIETPAELRVLEPEPKPASADEFTVWRANRWFDPKGIPLTTETCQDWIDLLSDDAVFFAIQMPVTSSDPITRSQTLALEMGAYTPATLAIDVWGGGGTVYEADLELRPERGHFMANELPMAADQAWVALGVAADAPACPTGINAPADYWSFLSSFALDLRTLPDGGEGSFITSYYCYEGQSAPGIEALAAIARHAGIEATTYQTEGITCLGPNYHYFHHRSAWRLGGTSHETITETQTIAFHHPVGTSSEETLTVTPTIASDLDAGWALYDGTDSEPNLSQPIGETLTTLSGASTHIWLVSDLVTPGIADGPYWVELTLTNAASPEDAQTASDTVWVGDWVAPPGGEPANPFLPLIVR